MSALLRTLRRRRKKPAPAHSPLAALPLELHFLIIDEFIYDILALRVLCLVSQTWALYGQSLLFRSVQVRRRTAPAFSKLLDGNNGLERHIRELTFLETFSLREWPKRVLSLSTVFPAKLSGLRALTVLHWHFASGADAAQWDCVTRLHLRNCSFPDTHAMLTFFASFVRLDALEVFQCRTEDSLHGGLTSPKLLSRNPGMPPWHFKFLALGEFPRTALMDWMASSPTNLKVDHLRVLSWSPDATSLNALLAKIGGTVGHLDLSATYFWADHAPTSASISDIRLSLSPCTALTRLTFSERPVRDLGLGVLAVLLDSRPCAELSTISFHVNITQTYADVSWEHLEAALAAERYRRLKNAVFHIWGKGGRVLAGQTTYEEVVMHIQERMVLLRNKGVLRFVCEEEGE